MNWMCWPFVGMWIMGVWRLTRGIRRQRLVKGVGRGSAHILDNWKLDISEVDKAPFTPRVQG